jgi:hypothetical protein
MEERIISRSIHEAQPISDDQKTRRKYGESMEKIPNEGNEGTIIMKITKGTCREDRKINRITNTHAT